jgi:mono/diheme cytochrome c family protein
VVRRLARVACGLVLPAVVALVLALGAFAGWRLYDRDPEISAADVAPTSGLVARGEYLVKAADCAACHTVPGGKPFAGGLAFPLPFGTIWSTNITPDKETGIGTWSDDDFVRALHEGVAKDGSHLYPAFPYTSYTGLSRDDAVAMKAWLFTVAPVNAPARPNRLSLPFNQRWTLAFWNLAFLDQRRFRPDPAATDVQNRGAYLATALGHCGECHTPRNPGFAMETGRQFGGAQLQGWHAYNITSDPYGIGGWSDVQIADYLNHGHAIGRGSAAGPMAEAVADSLQYLSADDTKALVAYLRRVQPVAGTPGTQIDPAPAAMAGSAAWAPPPSDRKADHAETALGQRIFEGACASCHSWNGNGRQTDYAALAGSQAVNDLQGVNLVQVLLAGADLKTKHGTGYMPSFRAAYSDAEIAAVANYVIGHFGGKAGQVTAETVRRYREVQP